MAHHGIEEIPVSCRIGMRATELPNIHNDPFDRLIIATAQSRDLKILSMDEIIPNTPAWMWFGNDPRSLVGPTVKVSSHWPAGSSREAALPHRK